MQAQDAGLTTYKWQAYCLAVTVALSGLATYTIGACTFSSLITTCMSCAQLHCPNNAHEQLYNLKACPSVPETAWTLVMQAASERQAFNAEDFPSVSGGPGGPGVMSGGRWAGAGGAPGGRITAEDFPALPGETLVPICAYSASFTQAQNRCVKLLWTYHWTEVLTLLERAFELVLCIAFFRFHMQPSHHHAMHPLRSQIL